DASFAVEAGERIALLGRNGAGKSTLMKLLDRSIAPDCGDVIHQSGITVARLEQDVPLDLEGTVFDVAAAGLGDAGTLLARYHEVSVRVGKTGAEADLREMDRLHHQLEAADA